MEVLAPFVLVEAVPNLSFGPDEPGLAAVLEALDRQASPGWALLDVHSDPDHRRSVLTLAGACAPLARALRAMATAALDHGDLSRHEGVHPRLGIVDVLPLVGLDDAPRHVVSGLGLDLAGWLARQGVAVHLYGGLARNEQRRELPFIRRAQRIEPAGHDALPDRSPEVPRPSAGACCVGVRAPLVAYNVLLDSTDLAVGRAIASQVRESGGGPVGARSLAFALPARAGRVQVSFNLTRVAPNVLADVFALVRTRAREHGVEVVAGELVGLAPEHALPDDPADAGLGERPTSLEARLNEIGLRVGDLTDRTSC